MNEEFGKPKPMTLDQAIHHIENLVMKLEHDPSMRPHKSEEANEAFTEDHRNLVRWLLELQKWRKGEIPNETEARHRIDAQDLGQAIALLEKVARRQDYADSVLDKPEDRLWHDEDKTWWRREGWRLLRADPPPEIEELARQAQEWRKTAVDGALGVDGEGKPTKGLYLELAARVKAWQVAIERAFGFEHDAVNHTPEWAEEIIFKEFFFKKATRPWTKDAKVLARALLKFTREGVADDEAYDLAVVYQKHEEKA